MKKQNTENQKETKTVTKLVLRNTIYTEEELIARMQDCSVTKSYDFEFVKKQKDLFNRLEILKDCKKIFESKKCKNNCGFCDFYLLLCTQEDNEQKLQQAIMECEDDIRATSKKEKAKKINSLSLDKAWDFFVKYKLTKDFPAVTKESLSQLITNADFSELRVQNKKKIAKDKLRRMIVEISKIYDDDDWGNKAADNTLGETLNNCKKSRLLPEQKIAKSKNQD